MKSLRKQKAVLLIKKAERSEVPPATLLAQVAGRSRYWIMSRPLDEVFVSLLALQLHRPSFFDGEVLGLIAKRLLAAEREIGGPYGSDTPEGLEANAAIAQLFLLLKAPLPKVQAYVKKQMERHKASSALLKLLVQFPKSLIAGRPVSSSLSSSRPRNDAMAALVIRDLKELHGSLETSALTMWQELSRVQSYPEIINFTLDFALSLKSTPDFLNSDLYSELTRANIYFWMAYVIYDDFIDEEGVPTLLPVANSMHRRSLSFYKRAFKSDTEMVDHYFDRVDEANAWELANCRFSVKESLLTIEGIPNYGNKMILARRALGHVIGPLLIVRRLSISKKTYDAVYHALCHYLIARQLGDDLHDWADDIRKGHANYVVAYLLRRTKIKSGVYECEKLEQQLRRYFFNYGVRHVSAMIKSHTKKSRQYFNASGLMKESGLFFGYLKCVDQIADASLRAQKDSQTFVATYKA